MHNKKTDLYGGIVWVLSGLSLTIYAIMGLLGTSVYGVEELVTLINSAQGPYIYLAAFISIFVEGLYFIGSFFPGGTLILIIAIVSQIVSVQTFLLTILVIFLGWCAVGAVNIYLALHYRKFIQKHPVNQDYVVTDKLWLTWFPAFRANHEVAQVTEGAAPLKVFISSLRVKIIASLGAALYTFILPFVMDINDVSNEEGFWSMSLVALVTFVVGVNKIVRYVEWKSFGLESGGESK